MWAGAIVSAIGTAANLGMGIWSNVRAAKAKTGQVGVSGAQGAALSSSRYTADRLSELGGMSAAQYQRALQEPDVQASMTQQAMNQMAQTPFQDSYQREALAKVMLSRMFAERQRAATNIAEIDAAQKAANAMNAFQAQSQVAQQEAQAQAQRNAIIARNEQIQTNRWNTFANMLGNIGQMAGMTAEGIELALKEKETAQTQAQNQQAANNQLAMINATTKPLGSAAVSYGNLSEGGLTSPDMSGMKTGINPLYQQGSLDNYSDFALAESNFNYLKSGTIFD